MKKIILLLVLVALTSFGFAKKVKFAVDMTGMDIDPGGVHIAGDFQTVAGFPGGNWEPDTTPLEKEGETNIYSIIVDIPAFQKYEYRFINGNGFYGSEFIPFESRVGHEFNDNRWIFVDSIANDTTYVGAILFGGNAPEGMHLLRFQVNMQHEPNLAPEGVHVAGNFQGWDPMTIRLYSFVDQLYEVICYVYPGSYEYKFYNGNTVESSEIVSGNCTVNGNRQAEVLDHMVVDPVCFAYCVDCMFVGIGEKEIPSAEIFYPNPSSDFILFRFPSENTFSVSIYNTSGAEILREETQGQSQCRLNIANLSKGLYFVVLSLKGKTQLAKLVKN